MKTAAILAFAEFALKAIERVLDFIEDAKELNASEGEELKGKLRDIQARADTANSRADSLGI
ncbi:hypothetical protein B5C34_05140 [Pacificimonas flava]|uniref:Uncharacterized protein n=2 Tax=Pacificimonas TaxID=1960290 RepID=A0A219B451_9SPHN|nr:MULTISPECIES: hypothetical protein [Pacificimonas]MBZ6377397.1 hypothetical protein [Pacificimonas aurantium]OWV32896.1 hypothetical protein B5C34_05140 [Pacificimonas flava]